MRRYILALLFAACGGGLTALPAQTPTTKIPSVIVDTVTIPAIAVGDTLAPRFTITTDAFLKVVGTRIKANSCGIGHIFYRTWLGPLLLNTHVVEVPVCPQPKPLIVGDTTKVPPEPTDTTKSPPTLIKPPYEDRR